MSSILPTHNFKSGKDVVSLSDSLIIWQHFSVSQIITLSYYTPDHIPLLLRGHLATPKHMSGGKTTPAEMMDEGVDISDILAINHSWGAYARGRITSPTLWCHSWQSLLPSLYAGYLPVPSNTQQEASTCHSHDFCECPLSLLHAGLSLLETT